MKFTQICKLKKKSFRRFRHNKVSAVAVRRVKNRKPPTTDVSLFNAPLPSAVDRVEFEIARLQMP